MPKGFRLRPNTFFLILLEVGKPELGASTGWGESTGLTEPNLIERLTQIGNPSHSTQNYGTLKSYMSQFKNGSSNVANSPTYFPFGKKTYVASFKQRMRIDYDSALEKMKKLVDSFLDLESDSNRKLLAALLVEAILADDSIEETLQFDTGKHSVSRKHLNNEKEIDLIPFLVTTWFNVSVHKSNSCEAENVNIDVLDVSQRVENLDVSMDFGHKKTAPSSPDEEENDAVNDNCNQNNDDPEVEVVQIPENKTQPTINMTNNSGVMVGVNNGTINLCLGGAKDDK